MSNATTFSTLPIVAIPNPWIETDTSENPPATIKTMLLTEENCLSIMQTVDTLMRDLLNKIDVEMLHIEDKKLQEKKDPRYDKLCNFADLSNILNKSFKVYLQPSPNAKCNETHLKTTLLAARFFHKNSNLQAFFDVMFTLDTASYDTCHKNALQNLSRKEQAELKKYRALIGNHAKMTNYHDQLASAQRQSAMIPHLPSIRAKLMKLYEQRSAIIEKSESLKKRASDLDISNDDTKSSNLHLLEKQHNLVKLKALKAELESIPSRLKEYPMSPTTPAHMLNLIKQRGEMKTNPSNFSAEAYLITHRTLKRFCEMCQIPNMSTKDLISFLQERQRLFDSMSKKDLTSLSHERQQLNELQKTISSLEKEISECDEMIQIEKEKVDLKKSLTLLEKDIQKYKQYFSPARQPLPTTCREAAARFSAFNYIHSQFIRV